MTNCSMISIVDGGQDVRHSARRLRVCRRTITTIRLRGAEYFKRLLGTELVYPFDYSSPRWRLLGQPHDRLADALVAGRRLLHIADLEIDPLHGIKTQ